MSTDETSAPPTAPPGPQPQQGRPTSAFPPLSTLRRSRADRKLGGVAGGLGRWTGVDPLVIRILFVVLAIFGGSGILLYVLGWFLIADEGEQESQGQKLVRGHTDGSRVSAVVLGTVALILGLVFMGSVLDTGPGLGGLGALVIVAVVILLLRNGQLNPGQDTPGAAPYGPVPPPGEPGAYGQTPGTAYTAPAAPTATAPAAPAFTAPAAATSTSPTGPAYRPPPPTAPMPPVATQPPVPPAKRERSVLGWLTFCTALIVAGLMLLWNSVSDGSEDDFRAVAVLGSALAVVAIGLLVGGFMGRARGLIVLGVVLSIATSVAAATDQRLAGGVGERTWTPTTVAAAERTHRLGIGDAELDLTRLPAGSDVDVETRLGVGELRVFVPEDAEVTVDAHVGAGNAELLDEQEEGGTDLDRTVHAEPTGTPSGTRITIDAEVGFGNLRVMQR
jgi:phage shock protein PspC (stress-responsive transcriptional regulator)